MANKSSGAPSNTTPPQDLIPGYPRLGERMGSAPEMAIFRRFGTLNAQMLLYMQSELIHLENELRELEWEDSRSDQPYRSKYSRDCFFLHNPKTPGDDRQLKLVMEIKAKLKEYNKTLKLQSFLTSMPEPSNCDLEHIQCYMESRDMGPLIMTGPDADIWGSVAVPESRVPDLIALQARHSEDPFSRWVTGTGMKIFFRCGGHRWRKPSPVHGRIIYLNNKLLRITYWITSIIASILPVSSIVILYCVKSMLARLAIIAGFNIIVSLCLLSFTDAKRSEAFAVTAAYVSDSLFLLEKTLKR
ncbi:hypothetical protein AOQ84DRAFT_293747 [Glonium stellatum]|uniref:DUF6594 domain-containing protein n=1 Tax=Glonium stellatum TaxID=574774 RepID=A0A8E2F0Z8_9PEZI|nr:hypothetical protein AOQ84DRAFT_293747 [Glonium stellatum]